MWNSWIYIWGYYIAFYCMVVYFVFPLLRAAGMRDVHVSIVYLVTTRQIESKSVFEVFN